MSIESEPKFEGEKSSRFRQLVEGLVDKSEVLDDWTNPTKPEETMSILDAIEKNELSLYAGERTSDKELDAINCLTAIYDELKEEEPDEEFIKETVEQLKEYLEIAKKR